MDLMALTVTRRPWMGQSIIAERDAREVQRCRGSPCERSPAAALALDPPRREPPWCSARCQHEAYKAWSVLWPKLVVKLPRRESESICLVLVVERNDQRGGWMLILVSGSEQDESWTGGVGGPHHVKASGVVSLLACCWSFEHCWWC
jgi:hypothetical protein